MIQYINSMYGCSTYYIHSMCDAVRINSMCDAVHKEYVAMYDALMQYICIYSYSQHMVTRT